MKNRLISVIMGVYNAEASIKNSIESILGQSYSNIELLILDDGSNDETYEICNATKDKRLKLYRNNKNIGLTKSLNKLISLAGGEFIARQDADDVSRKYRLERQINYLLDNNLDACTTRAEILNSLKKIPGFSYYLPTKLVMKYKNPYIHGTLLIKKNVLEEMKYYDESFYYAQDYKLMSDLIKNQKKVQIMRDDLYILNMDNNISTLKKNEQKYYAECVRKNISPL
jgi:glycosyltransferase EpsE